MDRNEFFRTATMEICSSLSGEIAMKGFVLAVRDVLPIDRMFLQVYETDIGAMRTIAAATPESSKTMDLITPMPARIREVIGQNLHRYKDGVVMISAADQNPVAAEMLKVHGAAGSSVLHMFLSIEDRKLFNVVLTAKGDGRYRQEHAELLGLLKDPFTIALFNILKHHEVMQLRDRLEDDKRFLQNELTMTVGDRIIGADFGLRSVMDQVRQVAVTDSPVLLTGETGVGKDVIASAIHRLSDRREGPLIAVNCGAIPESLIDSELFGHEKGAFTGALTTRRGRFERAEGGTILLDEIAEMPLAAQVRLLRVLQNRELERVGGTDTINVDVRIIAATNRGLSSMVEEGDFREDLWFRLNVFPINIPPLRKREIDIPSLVHFFIEKKAHDLKLGTTPTLAPGVIEELTAYEWPGNVRELENVIERAMILSGGGRLENVLRARTDQAEVISRDSPNPGDRPFPTLEEAERSHIERALDLSKGKIHGPGGAGELLDINPNTLRHRMRKLGIAFGRQ